VAGDSDRLAARRSNHTSGTIASHRNSTRLPAGRSDRYAPLPATFTTSGWALSYSTSTICPTLSPRGYIRPSGGRCTAPSGVSYRTSVRSKATDTTSAVVLTAREFTPASSR